jgi:hypothetical protein
MVSIKETYASVMNMHTTPTPFELLLKITGLLRPEDLKTFLPWLPFLKEACWVSASRSLDLNQQGESGSDPGLILGLASSLVEQGVVNPDRLLVFIIANWEIVEAGVIEEVFDLLGWCHPNTQIEALCLHSGETQALEMILAAG